MAAAGLFGAVAGTIVVLDLLDQPDIGLRQLSRALLDQSLQILLMLPKLGIGLLALLLELPLDDPLVAEHADRIGHIGELVATSGRHRHVQAPGCEALHDSVERRQPVDEIAMYV